MLIVAFGHKDRKICSSSVGFYRVAVKNNPLAKRQSTSREALSNVSREDFRLFKKEIYPSSTRKRKALRRTSDGGRKRYVFSLAFFEPIVEGVLAEQGFH